MSFTTLQVNTPQKNYPVYIGSTLFQNKTLWHDPLKNKQVMVVSDRNIIDYYGPTLAEIFNDYQYVECILAAGESSKNWDSVSTIIDHLINNKFRRDCTLIALGGGVVTDITGFAASCYQRGVNYYQVPTSLLAQVDASIGGKTAINHPYGKNMIGAFYQPSAVYCELNTLNTLPDREFRAGLAEVIKIAVIADAAFFDWLALHLPDILARVPRVLQTMIERSCHLKITYIEADTLDKTGLRAHLNFGHTFAHAIECHRGYGNCLHGEAVAIGMVLAATFSSQLGLLDEKVVAKIKNLLTSAGLPIKFTSKLQGLELLQLMFLDKKNQEDGLTLILLKSLGSVTLYHNVKSVDLRKLLNNIDHLE